jgi:hypothetical protein
MIDEAVSAATGRMQEEIDRLRYDAVLYRQRVTLRAYGDPPERDGLLLCAEQGGPQRPGIQFVLTGKEHPGLWELWVLDRE